MWIIYCCLFLSPQLITFGDNSVNRAAYQLVLTFTGSVINLKLCATYWGKAMATGMHKVFVYGTLKRGEPNHHWFSKDKNGYYKFLHEAQTIHKFPLIIATKYNIPFLLYSPGDGDFVKGEVYEVNDAVLKNLDILEDHPNYYVREEYKLKPFDIEESEVQAWVYFIKNFRPELLKLRTFANYTSNGNHGLKYVTSEESTIEDLSVYTDICP